jgi:hypothetical protein
VIAPCAKAVDGRSNRTDRTSRAPEDRSRSLDIALLLTRIWVYDARVMLDGNMLICCAGFLLIAKVGPEDRYVKGFSLNRRIHFADFSKYLEKNLKVLSRANLKVLSRANLKVLSRANLKVLSRANPKVPLSRTLRFVGAEL